MPLLDLVVREAMDQDYEAAAQRRRSQPPRPPRRRSRRLAGATTATAVLGLLIALLAVQNSRDADVEEASRTALTDRIDARRADLRNLTEQARTLRRDVTVLGSTLGPLSGQVASATTRLSSLQVGTGFVAVRGPGVRILVDDNTAIGEDGLVRATDLSRLVNALWESGAEAIAINGRRLDTLSAIVNSSIAIQVNAVSLSAPYVVTAIGEPRELQDGLARTTSGAEFLALVDQFGYVVERQNEEQLVLAPAPEGQLRLRYAAEDSAAPRDQEEDTP